MPVAEAAMCSRLSWRTTSRTTSCHLLLYAAVTAVSPLAVSFPHPQPPLMPMLNSSRVSEALASALVSSWSSFQTISELCTATMQCYYRRLPATTLDFSHCLSSLPTADCQPG